MLLLGSDLRTIATTNELRQWNSLPLHPPSLAQLDALLLHIYANLRPKTIHYQQRHMLLDVFNKMVTKIFGQANGFPVVQEFGSFKMDFFTAESDLDLSVNFTDATSSTSAQYSRAEKIKAIRKLSKILYAHQKQGHVRGVMPIVAARVPVLKVTDCGTGIECDISIENKDGISRSTIISLVSSIDERFRILSYLMKLWAKANDINSSKDRTMSSMTIIALVAFHLQTRNPPILPPFLALLRGGTSISNIEKSVLHFKNFGRGNKESVAELFISLICKLKAVQYLWNAGICASMFEGTWIYKKIENGSKAAGMSVEDFWVRSENFARSVSNGAEMEVINKCIQKALNNLTCFLSGEINSYELKTCLFGPVCSALSPIANMRDNKYSNGRLAWEDVPAPQIERDATPGRSKVDKKRKGISNKQSDAKRGRYGVQPAEQALPWVSDDCCYQKLGTGFHFMGYVNSLPHIPYRVPDPYSTQTNLSVPHFGYGENLAYPRRPGVEARPSHQYGPGTLPSSNFSHQYRQPDPMCQYGRGFRE